MSFVQLSSTSSTTSLELGDSISYQLDVDFKSIPVDAKRKFLLEISTNHPDNGDGCLSSTSLFPPSQELCVADPGPSSLHICGTSLVPGANLLADMDGISEESRWFDVGGNKVLKTYV